MRSTLITMFCGLFCSAALAQDPTSTDGDKYRPLFENECVRVLEYKDIPGDKTNMHRHPAFVLYALSAFQRSITLPDGKILKRQFNVGDVMWSDSQSHVGENIGQTPTHVILVEMKSQVGVCAAR
jgi:beta-alanine degradation protein BauB